MGGAQGGGVEVTAARYRDAGLTDVAVTLYPQARHEILNERAYAGEITEDIASWLLRKVAR